jgi:hypothetical protein
MAKVIITEELQTSLENFLRENRSAELLNTYLFFIEKKFNLQPVVCPKEKTIYQSADEAVRQLESENRLWHEAEIKIGFSNLSVNEHTKKIYICPFTGKVFADNTHPNPQDAIYDWVSKCPENTERLGGLRVKRFFTSEDPEVIQGYAAKVKPKEAITKKVFSSVISGKLFSSKEAVINDFKRSYLHTISLVEVQNQNKFQIENSFLAFIQKQLDEEKVAAFLEALAEIEQFQPFVVKWLEE